MASKKKIKYQITFIKQGPGFIARTWDIHLAIPRELFENTYPDGQIIQIDDLLDYVHSSALGTDLGYLNGTDLAEIVMVSPTYTPTTVNLQLTLMITNQELQFKLGLGGTLFNIKTGEVL
jgi:hypothetical protein